MEKLEKFVRLGLSETMLQALKEKGFEEPTPIQEKIIPLILEKLDEHARGVQVLVLVPTRELAIQVSEELNSFKGRRRLQVAPIYGGQSISLQLKRLKRGVDVVVGTPGRVLDHIERGTLRLDHVAYVVLDEADEMLKMGFIDDMKRILSATNSNRITLLFSATMPREILGVARKYMRDYEKITIDKTTVDVDLTDQIYFEVSPQDKFEALCRIIDIESDFYGLVFCRTKVDVDRLAHQLMDRGYDAEALHGDISQAQREKILSRFKKKHINILVATDVAARGIDIVNLTHVINYAIPQDPDAYVHRIGRTGRAGNEGTAITFITPDEYRKLMYIKKAARTNIRKEKLPQINDIIEAKRTRFQNEVQEIVQSEIDDTYRQMARELLAENDPEQALAAVLKYTFQDELDPNNYNEIRNGFRKIRGKTRLFIARGRKDGMTKRKLVDFIKQKAGINDHKIDDAQVFDNFSFISVPFPEAERILHVFRHENRGQRPMVTVAKKAK